MQSSNRKIFIRFTSTQITDQSQYKLFSATFSQFGNKTKLYLDYNEKYGKVYYESKFDAQNAYNCLNKSNTLSMILDPPSEEIYSNIKKMYEEDIEVVAENLYDLYGNVITIFKANDGEKYVPFNSLCASGYRLFEENITAKYKKPNQVDMENLESFLNLQMQTYLILHKISLDSIDVAQLIERCTSVFTKKFESTNSKPIIQRTATNHSAMELPKSKPSIQRIINNSTASGSNFNDNGRQTKPKEFIGNAENHNIEKKNETRPYTPTSNATNTDLQTRKLNNNYKSPFGNEERKSQANSLQSKVHNSSNPLQNNNINKQTDTLDVLKNYASKENTTNTFSKANSPVEKLLKKNEPAVPEQKISTNSVNDSPRRPVTIEQPHSNRKSIAEMGSFDGYLQCKQIINKNLLVVSTVPTEYIDELSLLYQIEVDYDPQYKPLVGTSVAIDYELDGEMKIVRAVIVSECNNEYTCGIIDYGIWEKTKKVYRLPDEFKDIVEFSMICETEDDVTNIVEFSSLYEFNCSENKIKLTIDDKIYNAVGIKWNPFENRETPKKLQKIVVSTPTPDEINEGDVVMIVSEHNGYLGIRTRTGYSLLKTLNGELSNYGKALQALEKSPVLDQLVLVQTTSDIQRAVVKEINSDNVSVSLIDTGLYITVHLSKLYYIDSFAETRGTLHICKLKNYETKLFTPIVKDCLAKLISKNKKYSVVSHRNGVLDLSDGKQTLSEVLAALEQPAYKTLRDLTPQTVPIGETIELFLAGDDEIKKSILAFYITEGSEINDLQSQLEACVDKSIPLNLHVDELCVAKFEESWYRAWVQEVDAAKNEYLVYYFDFGNSAKVSGDNVRELPEHLTKLQPLAILCRFQDILEKYKSPLPTNVITKIQNMMPLYERYEVKILSKDGHIYNGLNSILTQSVL